MINCDRPERATPDWIHSNRLLWLSGGPSHRSRLQRQPRSSASSSPSALSNPEFGAGHRSLLDLAATIFTARGICVRTFPAPTNCVALRAATAAINPAGSLEKDGSVQLSLQPRSLELHLLCQCTFTERKS